MQISHKLPRFSPGFTLIELIVTISIGLLLFGGAMAGFLQFQERRKVEMTARDIQQLYVTARQKAQAREVPEGYDVSTNTCANVGGKRLVGYAVQYQSGTRTFSVVPKCGSPPVNGTTSQTYDHPTGLAITGTDEVIFYSIPDSGNTNLPSGRDVEVEGSGITYKFTVSQSGAISDVVKQ